MLRSLTTNPVVHLQIEQDRCDTGANFTETSLAVAVSTEDDILLITNYPAMCRCCCE